MSQRVLANEHEDWPSMECGNSKQLGDNTFGEKLSIDVTVDSAFRNTGYFAALRILFFGGLTRLDSRFAVGNASEINCLRVVVYSLSNCTSALSCEISSHFPANSVLKMSLGIWRFLEVLS